MRTEFLPLLDIIKKPSMHPWFVWIYWIDPLAYAVEAMMATELHDRVFPCEGYDIIPFGPEYAGLPSSCSGVPGSIGNSVNGSAYLKYLTFDHSHVWRNFGILWVWWFLFVAISKHSTHESRPFVLLISARDNSGCFDDLWSIQYC
jgi:ATP-binding cassette subfamily G (WHITE) protein 2 (SNQ2)